MQSCPCNATCFKKKSFFLLFLFLDISQTRFSQLCDFVVDRFPVNHLLELSGGQLIELHLEGERLLGHRLVRRVVVSTQVLVGQTLFDCNRKCGVILKFKPFLVSMKAKPDGAGFKTAEEVRGEIV